jgi:protoheme IX farnesyltransferase
VPAAGLVFAMGLVMLWFALRLYEKRDRQSARSLMLSSVTYISLMQIVYVVDTLLS